jgi:hypothetical protein
MKNLKILILVFSSLNIYGQEVKTEFDGHKWQAPYHFSIPKDWSIERFLIPISFAPQISYKGVEDIRFAPGWANEKSEEYWSYAFLWYLDGRPEINSAIIADNLKNYYTGLSKINIDTAKFKALPESLKIVTTSFKDVPTEKSDLRTFNGTVEMLDFMKLKPITLNCIVHLKICPEENKTIVFYELSPRQYSHNIWASLNKLWLGFNCKKIFP